MVRKSESEGGGYERMEAECTAHVRKEHEAF